MLRYYVLCCRNMWALKRHETTIPKSQLTIVINTLDSDFELQAIAYCQMHDIDYVVTESDGTPATGKNSVIDTFLASDNQFFVLVDGDDFLTPHGVWTYQHIANMESPPDVLGLEYQYGIWPEKGYGQLGIQDWTDPSIVEVLQNPILGCTDKNNASAIQGYGTRVFLKNKAWWEDAIAGRLVRQTAGDEFGAELTEVHRRWAQYCYKYISNWESHIRVVFFSRAAAEAHRYNPEYVVGEDTLMYLMFKDSSVRGDLVLKNLYDRYPTYVYDTRVAGIVQENKDVDGVGDRGWLLWMKKLSDGYEQFESEGRMHTDTVPYINTEIVWPEGYTPDTLGVVNYPGKQHIIY